MSKNSQNHCDNQIKIKNSKNIKFEISSLDPAALEISLI